MMVQKILLGLFIVAISGSVLAQIQPMDDQSPPTGAVSIERERMIPTAPTSVNNSLDEGAVAPSPVPAAYNMPAQYIWGDYDQDGLRDIFKLDCNGNQLLRNLGDGGFEDVTPSAFPEGAKNGIHGIWGDPNNDGLKDLFLFHTQGFTLFQNEGGSMFSDATVAMGLNPGLYGCELSMNDYDGDGYQDLLMQTHLGDRIYHNQGGFGFEEVILPGSGSEEFNNKANVTMRSSYASNRYDQGNRYGLGNVFPETKGAGQSNPSSGGNGNGPQTGDMPQYTPSLFPWSPFIFGDITAVYADNGLTGGATSGDAHLNVGAGDGIDVSANAVAVDVTDFCGTGLTESSNNIAIDFAGNGSEDTVSRSDHNHDNTYAYVRENALDDGTSTVVLTCDDPDDAILIRFGDENYENGVVFGQYANSSFSGIKIDNLGVVSVFHMSSSGTILDTGDYRLYYDEGTSPDRVVLYHEGLSDWCDYVYFRSVD